MDGLVEEGNGGMAHRPAVDVYRPARRQLHYAKQSSTSSSSSPSTRTSAAAVVGRTKNALMILNELQPGGLRCDGVTKSGPDHKPVYTANISIYGQVRIDTCIVL